MLLQTNRHSFLCGRNEPLVRYCFLWLLYGRNERFVQYCFLWQSCTDARVPSMMYVMGVIVRVSYALPSVGCCTVYHLLCVSIWEKPICFGILKSVRSPPVCLKVSPPSAWLEAAPPSSPLLPASELVSLPRPCLPRMEMFGGGVFIGEGM